MSLERLLTHAKALVDQVSLDNNGMMVGNIWMGGNGGLYSRETLTAADALRRVITELEGAPPEDPELDRAMRERAQNNQL